LALIASSIQPLGDTFHMRPKNGEEFTLDWGGGQEAVARAEQRSYGRT
jgi:hypothetical protein